MPKPVVLQIGPYPEWDQVPLEKSYEIKKLFEASDVENYLSQHGEYVRAIATRGELGADSALSLIHI